MWQSVQRKFKFIWNQKLRANIGHFFFVFVNVSYKQTLQQSKTSQRNNQRRQLTQDKVAGNIRTNEKHKDDIVRIFLSHTIKNGFSI